MSTDRIELAVQMLLDAFNEELGLDVADENFQGTPERASRMYREILAGLRNTQEQVDRILDSAFPCTNDQLVLVKNIEAFSLCPHHLLPVHYKVHVAYIPQKKVVGLSKLVRLVDILAKRPVLQEQFVEDVSANLMRIDGCLGSACIAEGMHYCMTMRGVRQGQAQTITSSLKGVFLEGTGLKEQQARQELLQLIRQ